MLSSLIILYDAQCGFCQRCRAWLVAQRQYVALEFIPRDAPEVALRLGGFVPNADDELVVVDDEGGVYQGPGAFLMCFYALVDYREWSMRLARPGLLPLARKAFHLVSTRRHDLAWWLGLRSEAALATALDGIPGSGPPRCAAR